MSNTANYNLETWSTSETTDSFNNFLFGVAGDINSNMTKIDTQMKSSADSIGSIKNTPIKTISATKVSESYYTATVSDYTAYVSGNLFILKLDITCTDTLTININSIGTTSVMKYKTDGNIYNVSAGDIIANVPVLIVFDGTRWIFLKDIKAGEISTTTETPISGILKGASNKISQAIAGTDYPDLSKMFYPNNERGGIILTDCDSPTVNGFYSALSTASNVPNASYNWLILHLNSNLGTTSAYQKAVAINSTTSIYERMKVSSTWGNWSQVLLSTSQTLTSGEKSQLATNGGFVSVLSQTLSASDKAQARSNISCMHGELVWTNASPTSSFAAQSLAVDLSNADLVVVVCRLIITSTAEVSIVIPYQEIGRIIGATGGYLAYREITFMNAGAISFGTGSYYGTYGNVTVTADDTRIVPYKIFKIKL